MTITPVAVWKAQYKLLPKVSTPLWADNLAALVGTQVALAQLVGITGAMVYTYTQPLLASGLKLNTQTPAQLSAAISTAEAWGSAAAASLMVVAPGASFGAPTPATIFSVVTTTLLDPPSLILAKQSIVTKIMSSVPSTDDGMLMDAFYEAFKKLTFSVTGINSITPTPTPLVVPTASLL